jgi:hypothetical protein
VLRRAIGAVAPHPRLWSTALVAGAALVPRRWWRRWPPLPRPDPSYLRFRMQTFYGDPAHRPEPQDVVAWLEWCQSMRAISV